MSDEEPLALLREVAEACRLARVEYAFIGAVARNAWAPPRATTDLDVALSAGRAAYESLLAEFRTRGFAVLRTVVADASDDLPDLVLLKAPRGPVRRVDLMIAKTPFEREAVSSAVPVDLGTDCRVVRPEHLIVYKLIAGRPHDIGDVEEVLRTRRLAGEEPDLDLVRRWAAEWDVEQRLDEILGRLGPSTPPSGGRRRRRRR
ncbi:MAG: hypothetical protein ACREQY_01465 [Candidatus Binatia bacterium]